MKGVTVSSVCWWYSVFQLSWSDQVLSWCLEYVRVLNGRNRFPFSLSKTEWLWVLSTIQLFWMGWHYLKWKLGGIWESSCLRNRWHPWLGGLLYSFVLCLNHTLSLLYHEWIIAMHFTVHFPFEDSNGNSSILFHTVVDLFHEICM